MFNTIPVPTPYHYLNTTPPHPRQQWKYSSKFSERNLHSDTWVSLYVCSDANSEVCGFPLSWGKCWAAVLPCVYVYITIWLSRALCAQTGWHYDHTAQSTGESTQDSGGGLPSSSCRQQGLASLLPTWWRRGPCGCNLRRSRKIKRTGTKTWQTCTEPTFLSPRHPLILKATAI